MFCKKGVLKKAAGVSEPAVHRSPTKLVFLNNSQNSQERTCVGVSLKLQFWETATLLKKTLTQVFSCQICKLFKNNYFEEHLWMSAPKRYLKRDSNTGAFLWILCIIQEHLFCRGSFNGWFWNTSAGSLFNKVASLVTWKHLTVLLQGLLHRYFSVNFEKFLWKRFCRKLPSNHISHDVVWFSFLQIIEVCTLKSIHLLEQW